MAQKTSKNATMGTFQTRGEDFLHLVDTDGGDLGGIDVNGEGWGSLQGATSAQTVPPTKTLYVDANRGLTKADTYNADGSISKPFTTIMAAVNQIIANGDNSITVPYCIDIAPASYPEMIVLEDPSLVYVAFEGHGGAFIPNAATAMGLRSQANNSNLQRVDIFGLNMSGGSGANVTLSGSGNFLAYGLNWFDSYLNLQSWNQTGGQTNLFGPGQFQCTFTNLTNLGPNGFELLGGAYASTGGIITLVNSVLSVQRGCRCQSDVNIDATSSYFLHPGCRQDNSINGVTVNGVFTNRGGMCTAPIKVNSGGSYTEIGGVHTSSVTLNGGSYTQTGVLGIQELRLNGIRVSAGTGVPNGSVVGSPGDLYLNLSGGAGNTLWVKETGAATNTGWVAK